jgi:CheY-like chemotaxis protein
MIRPRRLNADRGPVAADVGRTVLVVEDDDDLGDLLRAVVTDAGYAAAILPDARPAAVRAAVDRLEPACVLLDGEGSHGYGASWEVAAGMRARPRPVPAVMFTADAGAAGEARAGTSARSRAAGFGAVLPKPFDLDDLLGAVARTASAEPARSGAP